MDRLEKINQYLKYWQRVFELSQWKLKVKLVDFKRTDFVQSGDIKINLKNKSAIILITKEKTGKDNTIILHELIHLLLWKYDTFCEKEINNKKKNHYFDLLEKTVADLEKIFLQRDK
ncbi:MAG: hypothetical protein WC499_00525 [Patescibacteria group bacterium]